MSCFLPRPPRRQAGPPPGWAICFSGPNLWVKADAAGPLQLPSGCHLTVDCEHHLLIGELSGASCGVIELPEGIPAGAGLNCLDLRHSLALLPEDEQIAVSRAREILFWRHERQYCGVCGAPLADAAAECARICGVCGASFFPVLAPAVIVAVRRGDRLLLAHNRKFRDGLYSLIAGFVEAGESLEQTVRREVREEVGLELDHIRYFGSQCWPFPNSLMLGFTADYAGGDLRPDGEEITAAGFFRPEEFPEIPSPGSISRRLIDEFSRSCSE